MNKKPRFVIKAIRAVTRQHAMNSHALMGNDWAKQHDKDHKDHPNVWAHQHR